MRRNSMSWLKTMVAVAVAAAVAMVLMTAMVGCGPALLSDIDEEGLALTGEVDLPEGQDESFIEGLVYGVDHAATAKAPSCLGSDTDGWCNADGKTGCRGGLLFSCAMGQGCRAQKYTNRAGSFAGCTWANDVQVNQAPAMHCTAQVGGYCKTQRAGVRCDNNRQKTFYCAGAGNSCETRVCGRATLTGCSQNHPCEGLRTPFAACHPGQKKPCWWNGHQGHQTCVGNQWSWMCYAQADPAPGPNTPACHPGQTRVCHWNGQQGHQTCDAGKWSYLCHINGQPPAPPQCHPGQERPCHWSGYPGHQTCKNGKWSYLCYTNNAPGHSNYGVVCLPGERRSCFWNGHPGHQTCEGNHWSWMCHTNTPDPIDPHNPANNPPDPHMQNQPNGCHPGQMRPCSWKGHPGHQKCNGNTWSYLCYTQP